MKWTDVREIAQALYDQHPDTDPMSMRFTDLRDRVMALPGFDDDPQRCNEKILEAIQMTWFDEVG